MSPSPGEPTPSKETIDSGAAVGSEGELLWGTPIRVVSWITLPALIVILGVLVGTFLLRRVHGEFEVLGWLQLAAAAVFVAVGVVLAWAGYLAYSRITVADTRRFHKATVIGIATVSTLLVVTGVFGGSNSRVLVGVCATVALGIWATRFPSDPNPFLVLSLLVYRAVLALAAVLLASAVIAGVVALVDGDLPRTLASTYLGAGIDYGVVAIVGCVITARRLSAARRLAAASRLDAAQ